MIDAFYNGGLHLFSGGWWSGIAWPVIWNLIKIVVVLLPLMGAVAYLTLWERKLLGYMQVRHGPNRTGPWGLRVSLGRSSTWSDVRKAVDILGRTLGATNAKRDERSGL